MKIVKATYIVIFITGLLAGVFFSSSVSAQDISGAWHGKLSLPTGSLTIVFHISQTEQGAYVTTHVAAFLTKSEPQVIQAHEASSEVIMNNCIRCHTQLNTEFVKTGKIDYMMSQVGEGKACWDCHRDVPHGGKNSLSGTPGAIVPLPESPVPEWLRKMVNQKDK